MWASQNMCMIIVLFPFGFNLSILSRNKTMSFFFFFFFLPFFVIKIRRKRWPSDSCGSVVRAGMPVSQPAQQQLWVQEEQQQQQLVVWRLDEIDDGRSFPSRFIKEEKKNKNKKKTDISQKIIIRKKD